MRVVAVLALMLVAAAAGRAQSRPKVAAPSTSSATPAKTQEPAEERQPIREYRIDTSRQLFIATDRDGDDRIDLFELHAAMPDFGDPRQPSWFRRLDDDRDGFLDWPEFDRMLHDVLLRSDKVEFRLKRPLPVAPKSKDGPKSPGRQAIDLFDANGDGFIDNAEWSKLISDQRLPPMVGAMFARLDRDANGKLDEAEVGPPLERAGITFRQNAAKTSRMPEPWNSVDVDGNLRIDEREMTAALRRIDPELARWAGRIVALADRNGDHTLNPAELPVAGEAEGQAMVEKRTTR